MSRLNPQGHCRVLISIVEQRCHATGAKGDNTKGTTLLTSWTKCFDATSAQYLLPKEERDPSIFSDVFELTIRVGGAKTKA